MKTILAAVALTVLSAPAFAATDDTARDRNVSQQNADSHYGIDASTTENQRANAASHGNVALTRGPDDPRYEGSADTPRTWKESRGE